MPEPAGARRRSPCPCGDFTDDAVFLPGVRGAASEGWKAIAPDTEIDPRNPHLSNTRRPPLSKIVEIGEDTPDDGVIHVIGAPTTSSSSLPFSRSSKKA